MLVSRNLLTNKTMQLQVRNISTGSPQLGKTAQQKQNLNI
jgi:hypothetical protein